MLSFTFALETMQEMYCNGFDNVRHVYAISREVSDYSEIM